jgi:Fe-S-cluster containining protein
MIPSGMVAVLPPLYQSWMEELLPAGIAPETRATCLECAMVDRGEASGPDTPFNPATKCCTYHPELPNFLLGRILADARPETAAARAFVEERIARRAGATPYGLWAPAPFTLVYQNASAFGRSEQLLCPFYVRESGLCGIRDHREGVCSTFFCRYVRGPTGRAFWRVMNVFLKSIETGLLAWALDRVDGAGETATRVWMMELTRGGKALDEHSIVGTTSEAEYAWMWGRWLGREAELYRRCAELVEPLGLGEVLEICGARTVAASRVVAAIHASLAPVRPERVTRGSSSLVQIGRRAGEIRVKSQAAPYDHLDLPVAVIGAVPRLTAGPLAEALAALRAEGQGLPDEIVQALIDFEVIVPT